MLVLSRQLEESIVIGDEIIVKVVDIRGDKVLLAIVPPERIPVHRQAVHQPITRQTPQAEGPARTEERTPR